MLVATASTMAATLRHYELSDKLVDMTPSERAKYIIENVKLMTIATADAKGKPWASTVGFAYDSSYNLYWVSHKDHLHSRNIKARPQIGIVIFGPVSPNEQDGVYFDAEAFELENEEDITAGMTVMSKLQNPKKFSIRSIEDVRGDASWRIYKAKPREITKRANAIDKSTGQAITIREPVKL